MNPRPPVVLFIQEQSPLRDAVGVADEWPIPAFPWAHAAREQLEASFVREAVGLALVHFLRGPDEIFPCVRATARAGHDVVEVAFVRVQQCGRCIGSGCRRARGCSWR